MSRGRPIAGKWIVLVREDSDPEEVSRVHKIKADRVFSRSVKGFVGSISDAARAGLMKDKRVVHMEKDRIVRPSAEEKQINPVWGLDRIDQRALPRDGVYAYDRTGKGVSVGILDTGIRYSHADFGGRAVRGFSAFNDDGSDAHGHGTHVAGTVAGRLYGVAKECRLVSLKALGNDGNGTSSTVIACIDWAIANLQRPAVINMSIGGSASTAMDMAVDKAAAAGIVVVAAAGNQSGDACLYSPGRAKGAIAVGATNADDSRRSTSNYGACVDLFAPGSSIVSAAHGSDTGTSSKSGTSMAAPHVAGVAALLLEARPDASPQVVRDTLSAAASKGVVKSALSAANHLVYSRVVSSAPPPPPPPPEPEPEPSPPPVEGPRLTAVVSKIKGVNSVVLVWSNIDDPQVEVVRDGVRIVTVANRGQYEDALNTKGNVRHAYRVVGRPSGAATPEVNAS